MTRLSLALLALLGAVLAALAGAAIAGAWAPWWTSQANATPAATPFKPAAGWHISCPMTAWRPVAVQAANPTAAGWWHGHHGIAWGSWPAAVTAVTGTVAEVYQPRMLIVNTDSSAVMVVLPCIMASPSGGLVTTDTLLAKIQPGTTVSIEGYARIQPFTGYTIVRATSITVGDEAYTWARGC
ncbi:MAG TPA: hypothetical protein EYP33_01720 [Pyrodictium sp.]|uniref:Uncharacterized protein n=1 Tax=Pyrodictium delaneyi TaxID=1273541 RepID=A0A832ZSS0_9CREN|nr:hypothetical protein [Pyrodictium sp.]HIQ23635.1 hypothetical protein [Pyrodictium delaneyi]